MVSDDVCAYGVREAARRWGDARKTLTLFRRAGETATERGLNQITTDCINANLERTEKATTVEKLVQLPLQHHLVLEAMTAWIQRGTGEIN